MAEKVTRLLLCDMPHEGDEGDEVEAQETIPYSWDGTAYEIDVCAADAKEIREALEVFTQYARRARPASRPRPRQGGGRANTAGGRAYTAEVRAWARQHGHTVSDRGRIPQTVVREYETASER